MNLHSRVGSRGRSVEFACACSAARPPGELERLRILRLLEVFEHPEALPADLALRLGAEILALTRAAPPGFFCEPA